MTQPERVRAMVEELGPTFVKLGQTHPRDRDALRSSLDGLIRRYAARPLAEIPAAELIAEVIAILRTHHLRLPREMALLLKVLVMVDGRSRSSSRAVSTCTSD